MPVAPHLDVGAARRRRPHLDDDLALGLGDLLHAPILGAVEDRRPHGSTTPLRASPPRCSSSARAVSSSPSRCDTSGIGSISPEAISSNAARMSAGPAE